MARTALWLAVGEPSRTLQAFNWVYLGPDEQDPTGNTARFKVGEDYWSGKKVDEYHGIQVVTIKKGKVEVSY